MSSDNKTNVITFSLKEEEYSDEYKKNDCVALLNNSFNSGFSRFMLMFLIPSLIILVLVVFNLSEMNFFKIICIILLLLIIASIIYNIYIIIKSDKQSIKCSELRQNGKIYKNLV